jgi:hypothetical protein
LVKELQLDANVTDLSEVGDIRLNEPRLAYANLTGITYLPKTKNNIQKATLEVTMEQVIISVSIYSYMVRAVIH